jgi:hypothetical protein
VAGASRSCGARPVAATLSAAPERLFPPFSGLHSLQEPPQPTRLRQGADAEDAPRVDPEELRPHRLRSGGDKEAVVGFFIVLAGDKVADHQARLEALDHPADVVGDPAGGIREILASFKGDDLQVGLEATGSGGGGHGGGVAADDEKSLFGHGSSWGLLVDSSPRDLSGEW